MALIKCSECGKEVSDQAKICPNCVNPIKEENNKMTKNDKIICYSILAINILILIIFMISTKNKWNEN